MKELSIEEKAKACDSNYKVYTELINRLEDIKEAIKKQNYGIAMDVLCKPYPEFQVTTHSELKESEGERIRKEIIEQINLLKSATLSDLRDKQFDSWIAWLEKQSIPQVRTGLEWANAIDDACNKRYSEEYAYGEYCHEQSFKWGFQEGVDWLEKQGEQKLYVNDNAKEMFIKALECVEEQNNKGYKLTDCDKNSWWEDFKAYTSCIIEQKPTDKVEPKFKIGDWVTHNTANFVFKIINVGSYGYEVVNRENYKKTISFDNEDNYHLWTIQDAKDGDVLADGNLPFLFKKIDANKYSYAYCGISVNGNFKIESDGESDEWTWMQDIKPATKKQRDLLFQKMKEAGYEWDAEKKKLEVIDWWKHVKYEPSSPSITKEKPAWSEEDKDILFRTIDNLKFLKDTISIDPKYAVNIIDIEREITWLKDLKDRVQSQNTWKPSDEQMDALHYVTNFDYGGHKATLVSLYEQLKKLKE